MDAVVTIAALASAFAVYRLEKRHEALAKHVLDLEERIKYVLSDSDYDED
jgi:hypothetical protein